jgi:hypothetical protein
MVVLALSSRGGLGCSWSVQSGVRGVFRWVFRGVFVRCSEGYWWGVQKDVRGVFRGVFLGCSEGEYESIKDSPKFLFFQNFIHIFCTHCNGFNKEFVFYNCI